LPNILPALFITECTFNHTELLKLNMQQAYGIEDLVKGTSKGTKRCALLCNHFIDRLENGTEFDS
jgi:hypothetical protein